MQDRALAETGVAAHGRACCRQRPSSRPRRESSRLIIRRVVTMMVPDVCEVDAASRILEGGGGRKRMKMRMSMEKRSVTRWREPSSHTSGQQEPARE